MVEEVTKNPMVSDRAPKFLCGDGRNFQKDNSAALHQPGLYGRVARRKPLLSKRHMMALLGVSDYGETRFSGPMKPRLA